MARVATSRSGYSYPQRVLAMLYLWHGGLAQIRSKSASRTGGRSASAWMNVNGYRGMRPVIDAYHIEPGAMQAHRGTASPAEQVERALRHPIASLQREYAPIFGSLGATAVPAASVALGFS